MTQYIQRTDTSAAQWLVTGTYNQVTITQFEDRSGAVVGLQYDGSESISMETFPMGDPVVIVLPVGLWKAEKLGANGRWRTMTVVESHETAWGPGLRVNMTLDGKTPFPAFTTRWSKVK